MTRSYRTRLERLERRLTSPTRNGTHAVAAGERLGVVMADRALRHQAGELAIDMARAISMQADGDAVPNAARVAIEAGRHDLNRGVAAAMTARGAL